MAVQQTLTLVVADVIEIPTELISTQEEVYLGIDTCFIIYLPLLMTKLRNIKHIRCYFARAQKLQSIALLHLE